MAEKKTKKTEEKKTEKKLIEKQEDVVEETTENNEETEQPENSEVEETVEEQEELFGADDDEDDEKNEEADPSDLPDGDDIIGEEEMQSLYEDIEKRAVETNQDADTEDTVDSDMLDTSEDEEEEQRQADIRSVIRDARDELGARVVNMELTDRQRKIIERERKYIESTRDRQLSKMQVLLEENKLPPEEERILNSYYSREPLVGTLQSFRKAKQGEPASFFVEYGDYFITIPVDEFSEKKATDYGYLRMIGAEVPFVITDIEFFDDEYSSDTSSNIKNIYASRLRALTQIQLENLAAAKEGEEYMGRVIASTKKYLFVNILGFDRTFSRQDLSNDPEFYVMEDLREIFEVNDLIPCMLVALSIQDEIVMFAAKSKVHPFNLFMNRYQVGDNVRGLVVDTKGSILVSIPVSKRERVIASAPKKEWIMNSVRKGDEVRFHIDAIRVGNKRIYGKIMEVVKSAIPRTSNL